MRFVLELVAWGGFGYIMGRYILPWTLIVWGLWSLGGWIFGAG